jgi:glycerol-3-phosphate acyltransferase PlsY
MIIPLLLSLTAALAYFLGCVDTTPVCCERFLRRSLRSFGRGKSGLEALYREAGWKGVAAVYLPEALKTALAVVLGGVIMNFAGHAEVGRFLALFCLIMGTAYPATRSLRGRRCLMALCIGSLCALPKAGVFVVIVFAAALALSKYISLACVCGALAGLLGAWVFADEKISVILSLFCALAVIVRHAGHIVNIVKHTEPKLSTKKDLSYKFDENF